MASRTPPLQTRSQFHSHWGEFASAADLPNASGAALAADKFVLQQGDIAYVTGLGIYWCLAPGTAGGADSVWYAVGSVPYFPWVQGLDTSGYTAAAADVPGADDFAMLFLVQVDEPSVSGDQEIFNYYQAGVGGFRAWYNGDFNCSVVTAGGTRTVTYTPAADVFFPKKWFLFGISHTGTAGSSLTEISINCRVVAGVFSGTDGTYAAPATPTPTLLAGQAGANEATAIRCAAMAYCDNFLDTNELADLFEAAYRVGEIVDVGGVVTRAWNAKSDTPGATWAPSIGAASDLTRIGAALPSGVETYPLWL